MAVNLTQISIFGVLLSFLIVGFMYKKRPQTIKEYALGKGRISTPMLMATMIATTIGGGSLLGISASVYQNGLWFFIALFALPIGNCILSIVIIPKLTKYYGCFSIAELIGKMYGRYARKVIGVAAFLCCLGILGAQIKAFHWVIESLFPSNALIATVIGLSIVIAYASIGGVSSVIKTDVLQLFIFAVIVPLIAGYIIEVSGGITQITSTFSSNRAFFYKGSVTAFISLCVFYLMPNIYPDCFHRFLIGRDTEKNQAAAYMLAFVNLVNLIFMGCVVFIALSNFSDLKPQNTLFAVIEHLITFKWSMVFLKIALIAIIVSTADSLVNTGAIIFTHDILPQKISEKKKINLLRTVTILSGLLALVFACFFPGVLEIVLFVSEYYFIIIVVPFISGLFIKNIRQEPFWSSVLAGFFTFTVLHLIYRNLSHEIFVISILISLTSYFLTFIIVSKTAIKIPSFPVRKICDAIIEKHAIQKPHLGWIILLFLVLSIIFKGGYYDQDKEFIFIELLAGFLGFLLFFIDKLSKKYANIISLFIIWYCFSFLSVYVFLHQKTANFFTTNFIISIVLLVGLFSWNVFLTFLLSGSFLATLIFCLTHDLSNFLGPLMNLCLLIGYITLIAYIAFRKKEFGIFEFIKNNLKAEKNMEQIIEAQKTLRILKKSLIAEKKYKNVLLHEDETMEVYFEDLKINILEYFRCLEVEQNAKLTIYSNKRKKLNTRLPLNIFYKIIYSLIFNVLQCVDKEDVVIKFCCKKNNQIEKIEFICENNSLLARLKCLEDFRIDIPENILRWDIIERFFEEFEIQVISNNNWLRIKFPSENSCEESNIISFEELLQSR